MTVTTYCRWCGETDDDDHDPCAVALRNVTLGYCDECGEGFGDEGVQHDACMIILTGRPDLLTPSAEDQAWLGRLVQAIEGEQLRQQAPWN